jgi:hypothetical protein
MSNKDGLDYALPIPYKVSTTTENYNVTIGLSVSGDNIIIHLDGDIIIIPAEKFPHVKLEK